MGAIIGMTDLALQEPLSDRVRDYLQTARESSDLLLHLLNEVLDLSRIEAGRFELDVAPFSLRQMVDQVVRTLRVRAGEKGLGLTCELAHDLPNLLVGDLLQLPQRGQRALHQPGLTLLLLQAADQLVGLDDGDTQGVTKGDGLLDGRRPPGRGRPLGFHGRLAASGLGLGCGRSLDVGAKSRSTRPTRVLWSGATAHRSRATARSESSP